MRLIKIVFLFIGILITLGYLQDVQADNRTDAIVLTPSIGPSLFDSNSDLKNSAFNNFDTSLLLGSQTQTASVSQLATNPTDQCISNKLIIRFPNQSTTLDPIYKAELQQVVSCMQNNPNLHVNLDGYASNNSNAKTDLNISQQRANNVKQYLVSQAGIDPSRLNAQGFGEANSALGNKGQADSVIVTMFSGQK